MGFPTIIFDATNGSDTTASGAGPENSNPYGTQARTSAPGTTTVIDLSLDSPDLSEVLDDGTHCLWINCASGRQFSKITAVDDVGKTVTVADAVGTSTTGLTWAIGGLRKNFSTASSLTVFGSAGAKPGWTIRTITDQSISAVITLGTSGDTTSGHITIEGDSTTSHRVITQSGSARHFTASTINYIQFKNLKFANSNGTKTNAQTLYHSGSIAGWRFVNCIFGDATNKIAGVLLSSDTMNILFQDCEIRNTSSGTNGITIATSSMLSGAYGITMIGCSIHDCASHGISLSAANCSIMLEDTLIYANGGDGINFGAAGRFPHVKNCIINGNTGDGIDMGSSVLTGNGTILNTQITNNGAYGITAASGQGAIGLIDYCNFYGNATADRLNVTAGDSDTSYNPTFTSASTGNFTPTSPAFNGGFPLSTRYVGANQSLTRAYVDIGPQLQGDFPATSNTLDNDTTNGVPGTYRACVQAAYLTTGPAYGPSSNTQGTATQPAVADVTSGVTYGYVAATQAVGYITVTNATGLGGDLNVGGLAIGINDPGGSPDVGWDGDDNEIATAIAAFINGNSSNCTASATDNVVTITVTAAGSAGNSTTLTTTNQTNYAKTDFAGGANATTRTGTKTAGGGGGLRGRL